MKCSISYQGDQEERFARIIPRFIHGLFSERRIQAEHDKGQLIVEVE